jgi:hypothetical protein
MSPLLERLLESGVIERNVLPGLESLRVDLGGTIPLNILRAKLVEEAELLDFINERFGIPAVLQFEMEEVDDRVLGLVPRGVAETHRVVPLDASGGTLEAVLSDPTDRNAIGTVEAASRMSVEPRAAAESVISWALLKYYGVITPTLGDDEGRRVVRPGPPASAAAADDEGGEPIELTRVVDGQPERPGEERISFSVVEEDVDPDAPEMGNWDAPFDLDRRTGPGGGEPDEQEPPAGQRRPLSPTRREIPAEEEPLLLVEEEDWGDAGAALEEEIEARATDRDEAIIVDEQVPAEPIVVTRNVVLGDGQKADVIPPQPMTKRKPVDGIEDPAGRGSSAPPPARPRRRVARIEVDPADEPRRTGALDPSVLENHRRRLAAMETRDEVIDATLALLEDVFGPALFLARKGKGLAGWASSPAFASCVDAREIVMVPPAPREVWHALSRKRGMFGPISVMSEYPFLETPASGAAPLVLVLPVVIRRKAAGAFMCLPRERWSASPELRDALESIGIVVSEKVESILLDKKRSQGR